MPTAPDLASMPTDWILGRISAFQDVQKRNRHTTPAWQEASAALAPLFAEMAARTTPTRRPPIGIPYAQQKVVGRRVFVICPVCGVSVELKTRKDEDSMLTTEYALHYQEHLAPLGS